MRNRKHWVVLLLAIAALSLSGCDLFDDEDCDEVSTDEAWIELIDGQEYIKRYSCVQRFTDSEDFCADYQETTDLVMNYIGDGEWVGDDLDSDFEYRGEFDGNVFNWTSANADGYVETGQWLFAEDGESFEGESEYEADDGAYTGECQELGVLYPDEPPFVDDFGACTDIEV